jgi:DNA polymerase III epsilon subunit-like protein
MFVLIFDTETTGLPSTKIISPDTLHLYPYIVQFSFVLFETTKKQVIDINDYIVKLKDGITIPTEASDVHGITDKKSKESGLDLERIMERFFECLKYTDVIVGHNIEFDINMIRVELLRLIYSNSGSKDNLFQENLARIKYKHQLHKITNFNNVYCTLKTSVKSYGTEAVSKSGKKYLKFAKLSELYERLFQSTTPDNLHNSLIDVFITLRCYVKLSMDVDLCDDSLFIEQYGHYYTSSCKGNL